MALVKDSDKVERKTEVTEDEVRQKVVDDASKWLGTTEGSADHLKILGVYNSQTTLPRGHEAVSSDEWCAEFVSSVAMETGYDGSNMIPTECSVNEMTKYFMEAGNYQTADSEYEAKPGDIVFYDWQQGMDPEDGADPVESADHVGIVKSNENGVLTVIEGNTGKAQDGIDSVKTREVTLSTDGGVIRGYGTPDYAAQADKETTFLETQNTRASEVEDLGYEVTYDNQVKRQDSLSDTLQKQLENPTKVLEQKQQDETVQKYVDAEDVKDALGIKDGMDGKTDTPSKSDASASATSTSTRREPNKSLLGVANSASSDFSLLDTLRSRYM